MRGSIFGLSLGLLLGSSAFADEKSDEEILQDYDADQLLLENPGLDTPKAKPGNQPALKLRENSSPAGAGASPWSLDLGGSYEAPFDGGDPAMQLSARIDRGLSEKLHLGLSQAIVKNFFIDASTKEWEVLDTTLYVKKRVSTSKAPFTLDLILAGTIPLSSQSQHTGLLSQPSISALVAHTLDSGTKLWARSNLAYVWARYETAPSEGGEGGEPLPVASWYISQGGSVAVGFTWEWSYSLAYSETLYHEVDSEYPEDPRVRRDPDQGYRWGFDFTRTLPADAAVSFGYAQGSALLQPGFEDYVAYDSIESRWSISVSQSW